ncbi:hypothetical protein CYMTET_48426 [Cymbomonas tetramitiformis]|uniref:Sulfotransferase n=1 Tax=Cymbomonas tetramitiformis TaxID=36881 RepID=A0AAE0BU64_9CHLO|nr:hypothetical protein CYMTET_48426 [Cymbomonas tetramitiformis]
MAAILWNLHSLGDYGTRTVSAPTKTQHFFYHDSAPELPTHRADGTAWILDQRPVSDLHQPLLVLRSGRSGSTWLAEMLKTIDGVYFHHESIDEAVAEEKLEVSHKRSHMITALLQPTGGILDPSNLEGHASPKTLDCIKTKECGLKVVGYSICPSTYKGIFQEQMKENLKSVLSAVPWTKVMIFGRTNMIKTGLAFHGRDRIRHNCSSDCAEYYATDSFMCDLPHVIKSNENNIAIAEMLRNELNIEPYVLSYERLQHNATNEMSAISEWLGLNAGTQFNDAPRISGHEDLRARLQNFKEIETALGTLQEPSKSCLLKQLRSKIIEECELCPNPWNESYYNKQHIHCELVDPIVGAQKPLVGSNKINWKRLSRTPHLHAPRD